MYVANYEDNRHSWYEGEPPNERTRLLIKDGGRNEEELGDKATNMNIMFMVYMMLTSMTCMLLALADSSDKSETIHALAILSHPAAWAVYALWVPLGVRAFVHRKRLRDGSPVLGSLIRGEKNMLADLRFKALHDVLKYNWAVCSKDPVCERMIDQYLEGTQMLKTTILRSTRPYKDKSQMTDTEANARAELKAYAVEVGSEINALIDKSMAEREVVRSAEVEIAKSTLTPVEQM